MALLHFDWAQVSNAGWWAELYVHFVFVCSALTLVLAPFEEWAHENLSTQNFQRIHAFIAIFRTYGALNKRPFLPRSDDVNTKSASAGG